MIVIIIYYYNIYTYYLLFILIYIYIYSYLEAFRQVTMVGGHAILGFLLYRRSRTLDEDTKTIKGIKKYYAFIWKLFYAEYCLYPFL